MPWAVGMPPWWSSKRRQIVAAALTLNCWPMMACDRLSNVDLGLLATGDGNRSANSNKTGSTDLKCTLADSQSKRACESDEGSVSMVCKVSRSGAGLSFAHLE